MNKMTVEKMHYDVIDKEDLYEKSAEDLLQLLKNIYEIRKAINETQNRVKDELNDRGLKPLSEVL